MALLQWEMMGAKFLRGIVLTVAAVGAATLIPGTAFAQASDRVRLTGLSDVNFGTITAVEFDASVAQSVCLYSRTGRYGISAIGSGSSGAFSLSGGATSLPYAVEWSQTAGSQSGAVLQPNTALTGLLATATHQTCQSGPTASASLIVRLKGLDLSAAQMGAYNGTLTLIVAVE